MDAGDGAALEDIIGHSPHPGQAGEEGTQDLPAVVDTPQEDRLVPHLDTPLQQGPDSLPGLLRQFPRVVELGDYTQGFFLPVFREEIQKLRIAADPFRQRYREAGAEADEIQAVNGRQFPEIPLQDVIGIEEGVAAGD